VSNVLEPRVRKWTREEYYKMGELGLFEGQRVELIDGEIIEMSPMGNPHVIAASLAHDALQKAFGAGYWVRHGAPLNISSVSEPEPDIGVVKGTPREFKDHPSTALLAVEVSETSLRMDRKRKASLYASAGVQDYWIVNLIDRQLEVYREPKPDRAQPFGFGYTNQTILKTGDSVTPLAAPNAKIAVADLLP
jgi:Uma2 family endonuclease